MRSSHSSLNCFNSSSYAFSMSEISFTCFWVRVSSLFFFCSWRSLRILWWTLSASRKFPVDSCSFRCASRVLLCKSYINSSSSSDSGFGPPQSPPSSITGDSIFISIHILKCYLIWSMRLIGIKNFSD